MSTQSLFEELGGKETIALVVDRFYEKMLTDEELKHFFDFTDMKKQRAHLTAFVSFAIGSQEAYKGKSMKEAHAHLHIQTKHFEKTAGHLVATLQELNVPQEKIDTIISKIAPLHDDIVTVKE
ncbi:group I truncated hemoglobin [Shimazuella kribbensis]|uniref:group I truncated hemoglobin n=1 Tax=Shimazuella kribbensis TaxID=139808 RepID=UPI0004263643|nr:group 1 truncated hemoglobin [Shimazuella kribbensis]